jgi:hypothetical protein
MVSGEGRVPGGMTDKLSEKTYVLVVSSGAGWNEDLVALLKKSCAEPIRRKDLFVSAGVPQAGEQGGGAAFDVGDAVVIGIWFFGGLSFALRTPEALKILEELVKGVDTAQIAIIWTTRPELVDYVVTFGKRCACEVKKMIIPTAEADMTKPGQVAQDRDGLGLAGTAPQAGGADLRTKQASASREALQENEKAALKRLGGLQQLIVT